MEEYRKEDREIHFIIAAALNTKPDDVDLIQPSRSGKSSSWKLFQPFCLR